MLPMQNYTLEDLAKFTRNEQDLLKQITNEDQQQEEQYKAPQGAVDAVLNYSKALSVRKTNTLGTISMLLN